MNQNWYVDITEGTIAKLRSVVAPELLLTKESGNKLKLQEETG